MKKKRTLYFAVFICISAGILSLYLFLYLHLNKNNSVIPADKITVILNSKENVFWKSPWKEMEKHASKKQYSLSEYELEFSESPNSYLEIALETDTKGIIFNPSSAFDQNTAALLQKAYEKGIHLVSLDAEYDNVPSVYIGIDNTSASQNIADYVLENIKEENILLLSNYTITSLALKTRMDVLYRQFSEKGYSDRLSILQLPEKETEKWEYLYSALSSYDKPAYIIAIGPKQTLIAARVLAQSKDSSLFHLIGFGETQDAVDFLKDGTIEALLVQDNRQMGELAIKYMDRLIHKQMTAPESISIDYSLYFQETADKLSFQ